MKAFDVAKVSNMSPEDYILYQISKSKKYDMEIIEEEAEQRGLERGKEKIEISVVLNAFSKELTAEQIHDFTGISLSKIHEIIAKYWNKVDRK